MEDQNDSYLKRTAQKFYYTVMSLGDIKVLLQGAHTCRPENDNTNNLFNHPIQHARRWS